jgi:hypothetical protein
VILINHRFKEEVPMIDKKAFCEKIKEIYPDIGECGMDVAVDYDAAEQTWVVDLKQGDRELRTHIESEEAAKCMEGKQCVSLGLQVAELRAHKKNTAD